MPEEVEKQNGHEDVKTPEVKDDKKNTSVVFLGGTIQLRFGTYDGDGNVEPLVLTNQQGQEMAIATAIKKLTPAAFEEAFHFGLDMKQKIEKDYREQQTKPKPAPESGSPEAKLASARILTRKERRKKKFLKS